MTADLVPKTASPLFSDFPDAPFDLFGFLEVGGKTRTFVPVHFITPQKER